MRNRNTSQPNRLHPPISIRKRIQLHLHLARLRSMKYTPVKTPLDILLDEKRQLQRQSHASIIQSRQPFWQEFRILRYQRRRACVGGDGGAGDYFGAPVGAEVVFGCVEDCD